jgi:hypothetical protein
MARDTTLTRGRDYVLCSRCSWTSDPTLASGPVTQLLAHHRRMHRGEAWEWAA